MEPFAERAEEMGLTAIPEKGFFAYRDRFGEVVYRKLYTPPTTNKEQKHPTDNLDVPYLAVFLKAPDQDNYEYAGYISNMYKFVGNEKLCEPILNSIATTGNPLMKEETFFSENRAQFRDEMIISSSVKSAIVGDIMPAIIINNSYNGTKAASVSFGISMLQNVNYITFAFQLGQLRMIHIESAETEMSTALTDYVKTFKDNITLLISESISKKLTEEEMLATLDLIEGLGKRRREIISGDLPESVTAWGMFMSIVRYSSFEANLNVKEMLENIAQSVLVIPARMYDVLEKLESE